MRTILRESLGEHKKPVLQICASADCLDEYWVAIRYSPRGAWRYFSTMEKPMCVREHPVLRCRLSSTNPTRPPPGRCCAATILGHGPFELKRRQAQLGFRNTTAGFCTRWLSLILELDREKALGLASSVAFVSSLRQGLEQGRIANSCLPELQILARHAAERSETPISRYAATSFMVQRTVKERELWDAYRALGTIVNMCGGAGGGPGSGGGRIPTENIICASEQVGHSADIVMSRASSALRPVGPPRHDRRPSCQMSFPSSAG